LKSPSGSGYIYILRPTPELWTLALPHRTQIVYTPDTSFILAKLAIRPGSICIEAGTGSGSFTHALARQVAPTGKVYTFEFHEKRHELNTLEFKYHGLNEIVTAQRRDVCADGFDVPKGDPEAVFLDLPAPWEAIPHLPELFNRNRIGRVCCFSPCIEQVLSTHSALRKHGFTNITTYDLYYRTWEARPLQLRSVDEAVNRLLDIRTRVKEGRRKEPKENNPRKRKPEEGDGIDWTVVGRGGTEIQTHTSFLTFGELMPLINGVDSSTIDNAPDPVE
jgi:tRNA (adenine57-N1/adenine58-N1)-methyltransferase catalytic subunit